MATVAVFLALDGGAYALSLPRNSVTSRHIAKGQVKGSDIGKNAVKSPKVADFSLLAKDFRRGQLPEGPQGAPGATKVTVKAANGSGTVTAHCAAGESATGGGADSFEGSRRRGSYHPAAGVLRASGSSTVRRLRADRVVGCRRKQHWGAPQT
jgi:hypothetical protein